MNKIEELILLVGYQFQNGQYTIQTKVHSFFGDPLPVPIEDEDELLHHVELYLIHKWCVDNNNTSCEDAMQTILIPVIVDSEYSLMGIAFDDVVNAISPFAT